MTRARAAFLLAGLALLCVPAAYGGDPKPRHPNGVYGSGPWATDGPYKEEAMKSGGSVVLPLLSDPDSLNPYLSTSLESEDLQRLVFPRLMEEDPDFATHPPAFTPRLAETWEFSDDHRTLTFHLKKDAVWSDGVPIDAEDVRWSWQTAKNKDIAWPNMSIKDFIDDVKVIDDKTVAVHYTKVYPYQLMDANDGFILPKHVFAKTGYETWKNKDSWTAEAGVAGGPYRVVEYTAQQQVVLEANPKYLRAGLPRIKKVTFRIIKNQQSQLDALLSGGIDALQTVRPQDAKRVLDQGSFRLFDCMSRSFTYVGWNCQRFPFDDSEVRRAMTLALDREDLVESLYFGHGDVACSPIISAVWAHDETLKPWPYDPDEAAKILEGRGWKKGGDGILAKDGKRLSFSISTNSVNQMRVQACTKFQANLKEIGVEMKIEQVEPNALTEREKKHDFDAYYGAWGVGTKVDEKTIWHSASRGRDGMNWVDYSNPKVDAIIDKARVMTDFGAAKAAWVEMQKIIHQEQPYTFVAEPRQLNAYHKKIRNVVSAATGAYYNLDEWFIDEGAK